MKVTYATISVFIHETEDYNKVINGIETFFSPPILNSKKSVTTAQGHYGNKITIIEYKFDKKGGMQLFELILNKMDTSDLMFIFATIESHWSNGKLYLRFDKQHLITENRLLLKEGDDVIRIVISFNTSLENIKEEIKKIVGNRVMYSKL